MEHIAALMMIVGCSPDLVECRELPAPVPLYQTREECDAALPSASGSVEGQAPRVFASCVYVDPALEYVDAELVWDVTEKDGLVASVEPIGEPTDGSDILVASNDRTGGETVTRR